MLLLAAAAPSLAQQALAQQAPDAQVAAPSGGPAVVAPSATRPASAGERGLAEGDCRAASEGFLEDARASRDPAIAYRATEIGQACQHLPAAWASAQRLLALDPENVEALRLVGNVALASARYADARRMFFGLLAKPDVEPDRALREILPPLAEGDLAPAAWQVFKDLPGRDALSAPVLSSMARMACNADDLARCRALIGEARAKGGGNDAATIRLAAAEAAASGDADRALGEAQLVAQGDPQDNRFAVVETLLTLDRRVEARAEIERIAAEPDHAVEADRRLALLAFNEGDYLDAERRFSARIQRNEGTGEGLFYLAMMAERLGRTDAALPGYEELVRAGAGLAPRSRAARLLVARGEAPKAMRLFDDWLRSGRGDFIDTELARARALSEGGMRAEALQGIDLALKRHPEHPELRYQRAVELDSAGRSREAIKEFEALLKERPDDANVLNALGYTLADRKKSLRRAENLVRAALEQRPDNAAFLDSLGWVRYRRGDKIGALPPLERAWQLSREGEIAAHWGEVLWSMGDQAGARSIWARALVAAPESKPLRATIDRLTGTPDRKP